MIYDISIRHQDSELTEVIFLFESCQVSYNQNDDDTHISIVKITPPTMANRIDKILNQLTVPKVIVPKECDDEVSCLHQLEENKGNTNQSL